MNELKFYFSVLKRKILGFLKYFFYTKFSSYYYYGKYSLENDFLYYMSNNRLNEKERNDFLRGYLEPFLFITKPEFNDKLILKIKIKSKDVFNFLNNYFNIPHFVNYPYLIFEDVNALDFLGMIYENANIYSVKIYKIYKSWCCYIQKSLKKNIKIYKVSEDAILPAKKRISDSGYDLTIIKKINTIGNIEFYTTGLKIENEAFGWYFIVVPRSSISKMGYILVNSVGIIDRGYKGELILALYKIDNSFPDLKLPCRIAQLIPVPINHFSLIEIFNQDEILKTDRDQFGFGSTN